MIRMATGIGCLVATSAALGVTLAPPAEADPIEYVMILDDEGVYYESMTDVIDLGKYTCRMLRSGAAVPAALNNVASSGYAPYETGIIVYAAGQKMCPDVLPVIESWAQQGSDTAPVSHY